MGICAAGPHAQRAARKQRKTEQWKHFCQEMVGPRRSEYEASRKRLGETREAAYLQQTPQGDMVVIYIEAQDISRVFEGMGRSIVEITHGPTCRQRTKGQY